MGRESEVCVLGSYPQTSRSLKRGTFSFQKNVLPLGLLLHQLCGGLKTTTKKTQTKENPQKTVQEMSTRGQHFTEENPTDLPSVFALERTLRRQVTSSVHALRLVKVQFFKNSLRNS